MGASGYLAGHILTQLLDYGFSVRATVRNQAAEIRVKSALPVKHHASLTFIIIPDLSVDGAFDEAVKDVDGVSSVQISIFKIADTSFWVIHTAAPFALHVEENERDLLIPSINGTTGILKAATKYNSKVKRVVITSSFAAMFNLNDLPRANHTYSKRDWCSTTYEEARAGDGTLCYCALKALAEKAAWKAYQADKSGRYLTTGGPCTYQQIVDIIREVLPEVRDRTPEGVPGAAPKNVILLDNSRAREELGINFTPLREIITEMALDLFEQEKTWAANRKG
ncbi:hypothetical protein V501_04788 [Pseudogymnoascus sp. VKM F-4519 (FW-2642)]|nr:hypothetical protein V501_04788 [Pseudogymnoascus sp. VKM F-4519 (FW-2642)]